jgi:hypothetical protein
MIPYEIVSMHDQLHRYSVVEENFDLSPADVATVLILDKNTFKYNLYVVVKTSAENAIVNPYQIIENCRPLDLEHARIFYPHLEISSYGF